MEMTEGNVLTVCGQQCTIEFQPSADQSWQSCAKNELNQAAIYPSPYANVHKGELCKMGGCTGNSDESTWQVPNQEKRQRDLVKFEEFKHTLSKDQTQAKNHSKVLEFMAKTGLRQLGKPRIGIFADCQRPEPEHNEINSWQHMLNVIDKKALQRDIVELFLKV